MDNHHSDFIYLSPAVERHIKPWIARVRQWNEHRRLRSAERARSEIVRSLDARIRHDIGETDLKPLSPSSALKSQNAAQKAFKAMLNRSA